MTVKLTTLWQSIVPSPLGDLLLAANDNALLGVWFVTNQKHSPDTQDWKHAPTHPILKSTQQQLHEYFHHERRVFEIPLDTMTGTPFQQATWQALQTIPYGKTRSYGQIAQHIQRPSAIRAVGAAIGRNPHSIVVPCHRILGANGSLTGFAGGLQRKAALLSLEQKA